VILVTGASRGLGRAICERLLSTSRPVMGLAREVESLPFPSLSCDVSSYESVQSIAKRLKQDGVQVEALINAAGIASMNLAVTTPPKVSQRIIETNLLGTIYCCQLFAPLMMRQKRGTIINFSTIAVALALKGEAIYAASKAGVECFSRAFAREMADFNIPVNCIAPGPIQTALLNGVSADQVKKITDQQIFTRQFEPRTIADLVEILLDPRSASLTGQVLSVGGA
jgi:3-oxoacyl-[acyl-carrier protein] reductase